MHIKTYKLYHSDGSWVNVWTYIARIRVFVD